MEFLGNGNCHKLKGISRKEVQGFQSALSSVKPVFIKLSLQEQAQGSYEISRIEILFGSFI